MGDIHIQLLGRLDVQIAGHSVGAFDTHKSEELLCFVLLQRHRPHHREALTDLLCREAPAKQAKKALRQILWRLQSALEVDGSPETSLLQVDRDWIGVNPRCALWLDVDILERTYAVVANTPGETLTTGQAQLLSQAADLYEDDLLVGWYEDWCLFERERLQNLYLGLLDKLMGYCETHGEYDSGLQYGSQLLRYDRANERAYRRLMRLHYQAGARGKAIHQFELCVAALQRELGVDPSRATLRLYEQIRSGELAEAPRPASLRTSADPWVAELSTSLMRFETNLTEFHLHMHDEIRVLRRVLGTRI